MLQPGTLVKVIHTDHSFTGKTGILVDVHQVVRCGSVVMEVYDVLVTDGCYGFVNNLLRSDIVEIDDTEKERLTQKNNG
jgi:hypothetical protein